MEEEIFEPEEMTEELPAEETPVYEPRPTWEVWAARIGLVVFIGIVIAQILQIAGAGR